MPDCFIPQMIRAYRDAAAKDPTNPLSYYTRALECRERGDIAAWRDAIAMAFALPHRTLQHQYCRAGAKLTLGDWTGWADYDVRTLMPDESSPRTTLAEWIRWTYCAWDGIEDLSDKTILVVAEQGEGDNIQMLRFIPVLADRARHVIVMVYPRLVPLVQCNFGDRVSVMINGVDTTLLFDRYVRIMSLPQLVERLPSFTPLRPPGRRPQLATGRGRIRGGICWAGGPAYAEDATRSVPARHLAPLVARRDIEWHSLQVGHRANDADRFPSLVRAWPPLITFADTADLITDLDLVVAVDTAVAHLAGCLGVPTYLILPLRSEWRWGLGDRTPWYPTMSLLRQSETGDWDGGIEALQLALDQFVAARTEAHVAAPQSPCDIVTDVPTSNLTGR